MGSIVNGRPNAPARMMRLKFLRSVLIPRRQAPGSALQPSTLDLQSIFERRTQYAGWIHTAQMMAQVSLGTEPTGRLRWPWYPLSLFEKLFKVTNPTFASEDFQDHELR